jgi:hypothetical protein
MEHLQNRLNACIQVFRSSHGDAELEAAQCITQTICELLHYKLTNLLKGELLIGLIGTIANALDAAISHKVALTLDLLLLILLHRIEDPRELGQVLDDTHVSRLLQSNKVFRQHFLYLITRICLMGESPILPSDSIECLIRVINEANDDYVYASRYLPEFLKTKLDFHHQKPLSSIQEKVSFAFANQ